MNYFEKLEKARYDFNGFSEYDVSKILAFDSHAKRIRPFKASLRVIFGCMLVATFELSFIDNDSVIVLFENTTIRNDEILLYKEIEELFGGISVLKKSKRKRFEIDFDLIKKIPSWIKLLSVEDSTFSRRLMFLANLCMTYQVKTYLEKMQFDFNRIRMLITKFDGSPIENVVAQFFKNNGIKTVTLQHGCFEQVKTPYLCDANSIIHGFVSDYFLVWDKLSYNNAVLSGIEEQKVRIGGPVKYISVNKRTDYSLMNTFVIFFDGAKKYINRNIEMLRYGRKIAKEKGLRLRIKLHPENNVKDYLDIDKYNLEVIHNSIPNSETISQSDFIIVSGSSVLIESLYIGTALCRYIDGDQDDLFGNINIPSFKDYEGLKQFVFDFYSNPQLYYQNINNIKNELSIPADVHESYIMELEKILHE